MYEFLLNKKGDILKNLENQIVVGPQWPIVWKKHALEVNGDQKCLVTRTLQHFYFCIQQNMFFLGGGGGGNVLSMWKQNICSWLLDWSVKIVKAKTTA